MMPETSSDFIDRELAWLRKVVELMRTGSGNLPTPPSPEPEETQSEWARFIQDHSLGNPERLLLVLGLAQYLAPNLLRGLTTEDNRYYLVQCGKTGLLLPTGETFLTLALRFPEQNRLELHQMFATAHAFYRKGVIAFGEVNEGVAFHFGVLKITPNYRDLFLYNRHSRPRFSHEFPAHLLTTELEWNDLVLNSGTASQLEEVFAYLKNEPALRNEWGLQRQLKPGYRCIFHGPSGTGKTLASTLLGKMLGREVYRVDLSSVISKYIGETSKNLDALFNTAEDKDWVLFFDEGDALFGKRVDTAQAEDRNSHYANQDTAFLLQRIENFRGLVVVASNLINNMDPAFLRRFQSIIKFDIPSAENAVLIWEKHLPEACSLEPGINLKAIAQHHSLSAASIVGICNRVASITMSRHSDLILKRDLDTCIKDEELRNRKTPHR